MEPIILTQPIFTPKEKLLPFALTDVLIEYAGVHQQPILHFWQLEETMILGMKDTRVTNLKAGLQSLKQAGYQSVIRNSGGLGVVADQGVLNVSLILPNDVPLATDEAYEKMVTLTQKAFPEITLTTGEVADSYCPGSYDLSLGGLKIAGIAQRRVQKGLAIMMYLSVSGNQDIRGKAVADFYHASLGQDFGKNGYPPVNPKSMTTLASQLSLRVIDCCQRFSQAFAPTISATNSQQWLKTHGDLDRYQARLTNMINRNQEKEALEDDLL